MRVLFSIIAAWLLVSFVLAIVSAVTGLASGMGQGIGGPGMGVLVLVLTVPAAVWVHRVLYKKAN